jgi:energy-coupling factor transporter ATP-binding protein EcfA2
MPTAGQGSSPPPSAREMEQPLFYHTLLLSHRDSHALPEAVREILSGNDPAKLNGVLARLGVHAAVPRALAHPKTKLLPLGIPEIDGMLGGGALEGHVVEVFGPSGSGKTQLVQCAAAMAAAREGEGVIYVDTNGSFSARRVAEVLGRVRADPPDVDIDVRMAPLEKIRVVRGGDVRGVVSGISDVLGRREDAFDRVSMIVVDSIGTLLAPLIGGMVYGVGHETMFSLAMFLKQVAHVHSCVVLVTNHTVSGQRREWGYGGQTSVARTFHAHGLEQAGYVLRRSALGESWPGNVHVRIQLVLKGEDGGGVVPGLGKVDKDGGDDDDEGEDKDKDKDEWEDGHGSPALQRAAVVVQSPLGGWGMPTAGMWTEFLIP